MGGQITVPAIGNNPSFKIPSDAFQARLDQLSRARPDELKSKLKLTDSDRVKQFAGLVPMTLTAAAAILCFKAFQKTLYAETGRWCSALFSMLFLLSTAICLPGVLNPRQDKKDRILQDRDYLLKNTTKALKSHCSDDDCKSLRYFELRKKQKKFEAKYDGVF